MKLRKVIQSTKNFFILNLLNKGKSKHEIEKEFGITRKTLRDWQEREEELRNIVNKEERNNVLCVGCPSQIKDEENNIYTLIKTFFLGEDKYVNFKKKFREKFFGGKNTKGGNFKINGRLVYISEGTGKTIKGISKFLKEKNPKCKIILSDINVSRMYKKV